MGETPMAHLAAEFLIHLEQGASDPHILPSLLPVLAHGASERLIAIGVSSSTAATYS
jgi:hypothetical protein